MDMIELAAARKRLGMSQGEFARRLGVSPNAVSFWEKGSRKVPVYMDRLVDSVRRELREEIDAGLYSE